MIKKIYFPAVFILACLLTACVSSDEQNRINKQVHSLQAEVRDLREQLQLKNLEMDRKVTQTRTNLPEMRLEVERMRGELQRLTNSIEVAEQGAGAGRLPLREQLGLTAARLDRIESKLQLPPLSPDVLNPSAGAPLEEMPGDGPRISVGDPASPEEVNFNDAMAVYKSNNFPVAKDKFRNFINEYPQSKHAPSAQFYLAESLYEQKQYEEAILEYQKVIKDYGQSDKVSIALLKQAYAFLKIGDKTSGKLLLQKVVRDYPESYSAGMAKKMLPTIH